MSQGEEEAYLETKDFDDDQLYMVESEQENGIKQVIFLFGRELKRRFLNKEIESTAEGLTARVNESLSVSVLTKAEKRKQNNKQK